MSGAPGCLSRTPQGAVPSASQQLQLVILRPRCGTFLPAPRQSFDQDRLAVLAGSRVNPRGNRAITVLDQSIIDVCDWTSARACARDRRSVDEGPVSVPPWQQRRTLPRREVGMKVHPSKQQSAMNASCRHKGGRTTLRERVTTQQPETVPRGVTGGWDARCGPHAAALCSAGFVRLAYLGLVSVA